MKVQKVFHRNEKTEVGPSSPTLNHIFLFYVPQPRVFGERDSILTTCTPDVWTSVLHPDPLGLEVTRNGRVRS